MLNRILLTLTLTLLAAGASHAGIYKWVDESGVVQYTQQPPTTGIATEIRPPPPPGEDPEAARQRLQQRIDEFAERRAARRQSSDAEAQIAAEAKEVSAFCVKARENLAIATNNSRVMERGADGTLSPLTPEQLAAKRTLLETQVQEFCQ